MNNVMVTKDSSVNYQATAATSRKNTSFDGTSDFRSIMEKLLYRGNGLEKTTSENLELSEDTISYFQDKISEIFGIELSTEEITDFVSEFGLFEFFGLLENLDMESGMIGEGLFSKDDIGNILRAAVSENENIQVDYYPIDKEKWKNFTDKVQNFLESKDELKLKLQKSLVKFFEKNPEEFNNIDVDKFMGKLENIFGMDMNIKGSYDEDILYSLIADIVEDIKSLENTAVSENTNNIDLTEIASKKINLEESEKNRDLKKELKEIEIEELNIAAASGESEINVEEVIDNLEELISEVENSEIVNIDELVAEIEEAIEFLSENKSPSSSLLEEFNKIDLQGIKNDSKAVLAEIKSLLDKISKTDLLTTQQISGSAEDVENLTKGSSDNEVMLELSDKALENDSGNLTKNDMTDNSISSKLEADNKIFAEEAANNKIIDNSELKLDQTNIENKELNNLKDLFSSTSNKKTNMFSEMSSENNKDKNILNQSKIKTKPFNPALHQMNISDVKETKAKSVNMKSDGTPKFINTQILDKIHFMKTMQADKLSFKLSPEYLGDIKINLSLKDGKVACSMVVDNAVVKSVIEKGINDLKTGLTDLDYDVSGLDVEVSDNGSSNDKEGSNHQKHNKKFKIKTEKQTKEKEANFTNIVSDFDSFRLNYRV